MEYPFFKYLYHVDLCFKIFIAKQYKNNYGNMPTLE